MWCSRVVPTDAGTITNVGNVALRGGPRLLSAPMTVRDRIREVLEQGPRTSLQISGDVGIPQGEVAAHLQHLARSLTHRGQVLEVEPAKCLQCEFTFEERGRYRRPSRCPQCRSERLSPPRYWVRER